MSISKRPAIPAFAFVIRQYDLKVLLSVAILTRIFLVALYLASGGPGLSEADLASSIALP
ncbi:hypothetical protein AYJ54_23100 [Bradyrhizobium centrolobii]|uniref:Uncharacterized protein n=1 Tax=Bradyrhizobium centrolobii TaxID=1505087 RepID=A0A176YFQ2_9BRAD|nr:hypothetical protein [Bradyrhizobium centrolobii]OAF04985.1 hypothetical protein AYJ54_23100 [Bradyrhizobium centrolobii]